MNILIIPSWYTSIGNPLNGIFFKEQAIALMNYFNKHNTNDRVFVLSLERIPVTNLKKRIRHLKPAIALEDGILTMRSSFLGIPKIKMIDFKIASKKLKSCINKMQEKCDVKFDLIHIHSALDAGIWYSLSNLNIPFVITEHSSKYSRGLITKSEKKNCLKFLVMQLILLLWEMGLYMK